MELVELVHPDFDDETRSKIMKDYLIRGLHPNLQMALKSMEKFPRSNINALADETSRLQLAGITSNFQQCCSAKVKKADIRCLRMS